MRAQAGNDASGSDESERDFLGMASFLNLSRPAAQRTVSRGSFELPLRHEVEGGKQEEDAEADRDRDVCERNGARVEAGGEEVLALLLPGRLLGRGIGAAGDRAAQAEERGPCERAVRPVGA